MKQKRQAFFLGFLFLLLTAAIGLAQEANTAEILIKDVLMASGEGVTPVIETGSGCALVSAGSWTKVGGSYRDPLTNVRGSDHDLRLVVPEGMNNAEALQFYNQTRARIATRVRMRFGPNATKVLEAINIYPPEQLMTGVTSEFEAIDRLGKLGISTPNLGGTAPEGLWTQGRFSFARIYERSTGRIFFNSGGTMQSGFADIVSDVVAGADDAAVYTLKGASQNAAAFAEKVAHAVEAGKPEDAVKNLTRTRSMLGKSYGLAQMEGSASYLDDLIARAKSDPFPLLNPSLRQEIVLATQRASLEARLLEQLPTAGAADKELITRWLQEIQSGGTTGQKIMQMFGKVPFDKIGLGLRTVFSFYQAYVIVGKVDEGDIEGALREAGVWAVFEGIGMGPGLMVMMTNLLIDQAKSFGYDLVAQSQDCGDLLAGVFTVKGREVNVLDDKVRPLTVDDLVTMYQRPQDLDAAIEYRAHHAAARGLGEATGQSDKEVEKRLNERCKKEILIQWTLKRNELDGQMSALYDSLANSPVTITIQPDPAVFAAEPAPYPLRAQLQLPLADIKKTEQKLEAVLAKLAGKGGYGVLWAYAWQLDGKTIEEGANRSAIDFAVDKPGPHTLYGEVKLSITSGLNYTRSFPELRKFTMTTVDVSLNTPGTAKPGKTEPATTEPGTDETGSVAPGKFLTNFRCNPAQPTTKGTAVFTVDVKDPPKNAQYFWEIGDKPSKDFLATNETAAPTLTWQFSQTGKRYVTVMVRDPARGDKYDNASLLDYLVGEVEANDAYVKIIAPAAVYAGDRFSVKLDISPEAAKLVKKCKWSVYPTGGTFSAADKFNMYGQEKTQTAGPGAVLQAKKTYPGVDRTAGTTLQVCAEAMAGESVLDIVAQGMSGLIQVKNPDITFAQEGWTLTENANGYTLTRTPVTRTVTTASGKSGEIGVTASVSVTITAADQPLSFKGEPVASGNFKGAVEYSFSLYTGWEGGAQGGMQYLQAVANISGTVKTSSQNSTAEVNAAESAAAEAEGRKALEEMKAAIRGLKIKQHELVTNAEPGKLSVTLKPDQTVLGFGDVVRVQAEVSGGKPSYSYQWSGNHGMGSDPALVEFTTSTPGEHRLSVTVTDSANETASADVTLTMEMIKAKIEMTPSDRKIPVGATRRFKATAMIGEQEAPGAFICQWQPHPEVAFSPFSGERETSAQFKKPGPVKVWVVLLQNKEGRQVTVGESERLELEVIEPKLTLTVEPKAPWVGEEVRLAVESDPPAEDDTVDFWWEIAGNALNAGPGERNRQYTFQPKDLQPVTVTVHAKAKDGGADLGMAAAAITAKLYSVKATGPELLGPTPRVWDAKRKGLVEVPGAVGLFQDCFIAAEITPATAKAPLTYKWTIEPDGCSLASPFSQKTKANASSPGSYTAQVTVRDANGIDLGSGAVSISIADTAGGKKSAEAADKLAQAMQLYQQDKLDEAINMAQAAATLDPKNPEPAQLSSKWTGEKQAVNEQVAKAKTLAAGKSFAEAFAALGAAKKLHAAYPPVVQAEALLNQLKEKADKEKMVEDAAAKVAQAKQLYQQDRLDEAIDLAQAAATLDAKNRESAKLAAKWTGEAQKVNQQVEKAQTQAKAKQFDEAFSALKAAKKNHPQYPPVVQAETLLNQLQEKADKEKMVEDAVAKVAQAKQLYQQDKLDEAIDLAQAAATLDAKNRESAKLAVIWKGEAQKINQQVAKAQTLANGKRFAEAFAALKAAKKLHPQYPPLVEAEAQLDQLQENANAEKTDAAAEAKLARAKQLYQQDKLDEAIDLAQAAAALDAKNREAAKLASKWTNETEKINKQVAKAQALADDKRLDDAFAALGAAKKLHPAYPPVVKAEALLNRLKVKADREDAVLAKAEKVKADREKAALAKAEREEADREKAEKARADRERAAAAKAERDKADRENAAAAKKQPPPIAQSSGTPAAGSGLPRLAGTSWQGRLTLQSDEGSNAIPLEFSVDGNNRVSGVLTFPDPEDGESKDFAVNGSYSPANGQIQFGFATALDENTTMSIKMTGVARSADSLSGSASSRLEGPGAGGTQGTWSVTRVN
jgi:tetratricopeptide (TPR) repeat protein